MELESEPALQQRRVRKARRFWTRACVLLTLTLAALWLLWGFRWPPTAEVVVDSAEAQATTPAP